MGLVCKNERIFHVRCPILMKLFGGELKHRPPPSKQNFNESTVIEFYKKYKQLLMNVVFPRISSIFDPQAIFSVELLPGGGQAHHKIDCTLTLAFIGSS